MKTIILASASPRRKELLSVITDDFVVMPSGADESVPSNMPATAQAEYLAKLKAEFLAKENPQSIVIGADTCVIANDTVLGKPKNSEHAMEMLKTLSGTTHQVITGCAVIKGDKCISFSEITAVEFYSLSENEISEYIATKEPYDKAGAYGIQGKGSLFVKKINGDYYNVVGLPIARLRRILTQFY